MGGAGSAWFAKSPLTRYRVGGGIMDIRKLLYMKSVLDHGSLRKAARELQVSQAALSKSMDSLEASVGVKLLERGPMGVVPTKAGEMLYSRAWFIQDEIDIARKQMRTPERAGKQQITAGVLPSIVANIVPLAVCKWREDYPDAGLRIIEGSHPELFLGLMRTDLDFVVCWTGSSALAEGIKQRVLFRDRLVVFSRPDHPVTRGPISWGELAKYPWVTHFVWRESSPIERVMMAEGAAPPGRLTECNSASFMKTVVENSNHIGMLANHVISDEVTRGRLVALPITAPIMHRNIAVFFRERSRLDDVRRSFLDDIAEVGSRPEWNSGLPKR